MNSVKMSCKIDTTDATAALGLEIWLDDQQIFNCDHVVQPMTFEHEFDDQEKSHQIRWILKNKTFEHTKLNEQGEVVSSACVTVDQIEFENINVDKLLWEKAVYTHDFNGGGPVTTENFYGVLGCNGTVSLDFSTPLYLWLLENI